MVNIVDKRFSSKEGAVVNRQKFIKRYKNHVKKAIRDAIGQESVKDFKFKDKKIKIKVNGSDDSLDIPSPRNNPKEGDYDYIHIGNKKYKKGDRIAKPEDGMQEGRDGSSEGGGNDEFEFLLTEKEFADLFFEDLELPAMIKKKFTGDSYEIQRCGYSNSGGPSSLNLRQTVIRAHMRRAALKKKNLTKEEEQKMLDIVEIDAPKKKKVSFLEEVDLRFNYRDRVDIPSTKAVMFCLMDVSGSMGEREKDIAKRFFILLNMFLNRNYSTVEVVFIRHAEWAEECDEKTFFYGQESGGTVISTGYEKIKEIVNSRYNIDQWNIYIAQASDGDNWSSDNDLCENLLKNSLLPICQYYSYIEIGSRYNKEGGEFYQLLDKISKGFKNLQARFIKDYPDIFEVFRSLFKKEMN